MHMKNIHGLSRGMTIIEVLVALALSLIVLGAVVTVYLTTVTSSGDTLNSSRLNQEVSAIMSIMTNDIRRAGYADADAIDWDNPDPVTGDDPDDQSNYHEPETNPFNLPDLTALEVHDLADAEVALDAEGSCIVYAYDAHPGDDDNDGDVRETKEYFGFRWNDTRKAVEMRKSISVGDTPDLCYTGGNWEAISDDSTVEVTKLTFDLSNSKCIITQEPDGRDNNGDGTADELQERDCHLYDLTDATVYANYSTGHPVPVIEVRNVLITLEARLKSDPEVKIQQRQQVTVRNNLVRLY